MKTKRAVFYMFEAICFFSSVANACIHHVYPYIGTVSPGTTVYKYQNVTLTANTAASYCDRCSISYYSWSAPGSNNPWGTGTLFTCSYSVTGQYTITLKAYCASGYVGYAYKTITVINPITAPTVENRCPVIVNEFNEVILKGEVTSTGGSAPNVWFYYDVQDHGNGQPPYTPWPSANVAVSDPEGPKTGVFQSVKIRGLECGRTYYFRCKAQNSAGTDWDTDLTHSLTNPENPIKFRTAPGQASGPIPAPLTSVLSGSSLTLRWTAGESSESVPEHRVYLGTDKDVVTNANVSTTGIYKGQQTDISYVISEPLEAGKNYYWRIDEVIVDPDHGNALRVRKGTVWQFNVLADQDGDGIEDDWELLYGLDPDNPADAAEDFDGDGLANLQEYQYGLNPRNWDTDGDGIEDSWEVDYSNHFYVENVQEGLNPTLYDAYEKTVGQIPAIWWYTWWLYCEKSTDPAIQGKKVYFIPSLANVSEDGNLDDDGYNNLLEYQNGTNPLEDNSEDYWTEYVYDIGGNVEKENEYVYNKETGVPICIAETNYEYDHLGRTWRIRKKVNPDGPIDNVRDNITLTQYNVDNSVKKTVQKGIDSANPDIVDVVKDVITTYTYDALGRQVTVTDAMGLITTYNYNPTTGLLDSMQLPAKSSNPSDERVIRYLYDAAGRQVAMINPQKNYEVKTLDSMGRVIRSVLYQTVDEPDVLAPGENNDISVTQRRMEYDNLGTMVTSVLMADAANTEGYDTAVDQVTIQVIEYDHIDKGTHMVTYSRGIGDTGEVIDSTWSLSDVAHDGSGRGLPTLIRKGFAPSDASQPRYEEDVIYNAAGQVTFRATYHFADRDGQSPTVSVYHKMEYDGYGRLVADISDPDGNPNTTTGDLHMAFAYKGRYKVSQTDPKGNLTTYEYDSFGQMITKTEDAGGLARITCYEYDRLGNLKKIIADDDNNPANGVQETLYTYDKAGRVIQITYPDNKTIAYEYQDPAAAGRPTKRTDQRGIVTVYEYDKRGNLLKKQDHPTNPTIVETYTYDARGLMLTAKKGTLADEDAISAIEFTYNDLGYLESTTQQIKDNTAKTITYERNQVGRPIKITYPDISSTQYIYSYTSLGQVDMIQRSGTTLVDYGYAGAMVTSRLYPVANVTHTAHYDDYGRVERLRTVNNGGAGVDFEYTYDENGNILQQEYLHRPSQSIANSFLYDGLNRLYQATYQAGTAGTETFDYDLLGNRDSVEDSRMGTTCSYGPNTAVNQYTSVCGTAVNYDDAGNLIRDHRGYGYIYDYENRLVQIYKDLNANGVYDEGSDVNLAVYVYDALGRRIEKADPQGNTAERYYYDDQRVLLRTQVSGGVESDSRMFVFGNYVDEVLLMRLPTETEYLYGHDHLYSVVCLFDESGSVQERCEYDAYGKVIVLSTNYEPRTTSLYGNPYTFTGRELDILDGGNLQVMYYRARYYDADTGRFGQREPLGANPVGGKENPFKVQRQYASGMNIYEYTKSNPVKYLDTDGLMPKACCEALLPHLLTHPRVRPYHDKARKSYDLNGKPCLKEIKCKPCPAGQMGAYYPKEKIIVLCTHEGPGFTRPQVLETLIHELVHAIQCDYSYSCGRCMAKEVEAYYTDGSCTTDIDCVDAAWRSCAGVSSCSGKGPADYYGKIPFPPQPSNPPREKD
ncbi:MAG TPA: RHS repeat-associated core domain-containing protein [Anaerohalosphaeraceae bacterium]|nr:RHS repeat-associated core domain-containing protein [Anaerohalosphaeraceae bacterium]HQI08431.1 RHS repeat-associated core domain-containing protein [Anaerohalosphaeraceae bacterium]HQJ68823.1 RHS repeat-associated core domain-containing protein [Anaerohalosphaeraceae bacterium]